MLYIKWFNNNFMVHMEIVRTFPEVLETLNKIENTELLYEKIQIGGYDND